MTGIIKFANGVHAYFDCTKNALDTSSISIRSTTGKNSLRTQFRHGDTRKRGLGVDTITRTIKPMGMVSNYQTMG